MEDQKAQTELNRWLSDQIAEARLSAGEIKEFVQWLTQKHEYGTERQIMRNSNDVEEFIYWFKDRIRQSSINEAEKRQLKSWLFGKLTNSALSSDEAERIREDLNRSVDS
ncbi:MAG TPA: hypothetical protein V6C89_17150 [Drouetiella sp.]|jgi:hypothetical protein